MTAPAHPEQPAVTQREWDALHEAERVEREIAADIDDVRKRLDALAEQPKESAPQPSACAYPLCDCPIAWQGELPGPETVCPRELIQPSAALAEELAQAIDWLARGRDYRPDSLIALLRRAHAALRAHPPIEPEDAIHREIWRDEVRDEPPVEGQAKELLNRWMRVDLGLWDDYAIRQLEKETRAYLAALATPPGMEVVARADYKTGRPRVEQSQHIPDSVKRYITSLELECHTLRARLAGETK